MNKKSKGVGRNYSGSNKVHPTPIWTSCAEKQKNERDGKSLKVNIKKKAISNLQATQGVSEMLETERPLNNEMDNNMPNDTDQDYTESAPSDT